MPEFGHLWFSDIPAPIFCRWCGEMFTYPLGAWRVCEVCDWLTVDET